MRKLTNALLAALMGLGLIFSSGCATEGGPKDSTFGALIGAALGTFGFAWLEKNHILKGMDENEARWLGALIGGAGGYLIGKHIENVKEGYIVEGAALDANIRSAERAVADVERYNSDLDREVKKLDELIAKIDRDKRADEDKLASRKALKKDVAEKLKRAEENINRINEEIRKEEAILAGLKAGTDGKLRLATELAELKRARDELKATEGRMAELYSVHLS